MTIKTDTKLVFSSENISFHAIYFTWFSPTSKIQPGELNFTKQTEAMSNIIGGFSLKWQLQGSTASNNGATESRWRTKQAEDRNLLTIMNIARQSRIKHIEQEAVWDSLLNKINQFQTEGICLSSSQIAEVILALVFEYIIEYDWNIKIDEEDIEFGKQIYSALLFCPNHFKEARKLWVFFKAFLPSIKPKKSDLNTLVAATFHSLLPKSGNNMKDFTPLNMWYEALDQKYNFSLGPTILGLVTTDGLAQLTKHDLPFLKMFKTTFKNCVNTGECHEMAQLKGKTKF